MYQKDPIQNEHKPELDMLLDTETHMLRLKALEEHCGPLCDLEKPVLGGEENFMGSVTAKVNCSTLFSLEQLLPAAGGVPPNLQQLPDSLVSLFTHRGQVESENLFLNDAESGEGRKEAKVFTYDRIDRMVRNWQELGEAEDSYEFASREVDEAAAQVGVRGKRILVIGSQTPWLEVVLLARKPKQILTLEYGNFKSEHPTWSFIRPQEFRHQYQAGSLPIFDLIFSFSSIEHSGLGRYGDPLNPWADIITVAEAWCASSPDAHLVLGVPTDVENRDGSRGHDTVRFNAGRIYGPRLYPYLTTNWKFIWPGEGPRESPCHKCERGMFQPVFIFSKSQQNI